MPQPGVVGIMLDKQRRLFYGALAIMEAERRSDKSVVRMLSEKSMTDLIMLLWAGLKHEDAKLTPEAVGRHVDAANLEGKLDSIYMLWEKVAEALIESGVIPRSAETQTPSSEANPT